MDAGFSQYAFAVLTLEPRKCDTKRKKQKQLRAENKPDE